jgi:tetratricopeptide (TPR) repeat protein
VLSRHWRQLWIGSLVLAALCGFAYGWERRVENPPYVITTKVKEAPELRLLEKGRYDEAAKAILDSIKDEKKDYFKYQSLAVVYGARAAKDPSNRDKWAEQAALYVDKSVSLAPNDFANLMSAAFSFDRIGDISGQPCSYYEKASRYAQDAMSQLKSDSIFVGDEKIPTQPIRDGLGELQGKVRGKFEEKCTDKP